MLLYLADVEEGGETVFLLEGKGGLARLERIDYKACDTGIKVGRRRSVVCFVLLGDGGMRAVVCQ